MPAPLLAEHGAAWCFSGPSQSHIHRDLLALLLIRCLLKGTRLAQSQDEDQDVFFKY